MAGVTSTRSLPRTLLVLGRVSNLPTVWSNCVAGWLLAGGGDWDWFLLLCVGATLLYVGGMYLNDAFDVNFDRLHRASRPIPSKAISLEAVWQWGLGALFLGLICLSFLGRTTSFLATLLTLSIFVYDAIHKIFAFSPVLMAACRFLLVIMAASTGYDGITGLSIWSGLAMATYVLGLTFIARQETRPQMPPLWPCLFLVAPFGLAWLVNQGSDQFRAAAIAGLILAAWVLRSLWVCYLPLHRNVGRGISGLLAGIVWVDYLALADTSPGVTATFLLLFVLSLLFQRFIPAT